MTVEVQIKFDTTDRCLRNLLALAVKSGVTPAEAFAGALFDSAKSYERVRGATPADQQIFDDTLERRLRGLRAAADRYKDDAEGGTEAEFSVPRVVAIAAITVSRGAGISLSLFCSIVLARLYALYRNQNVGQSSEKKMLAGFDERVDEARRRTGNKKPVASIDRQARARLARAFASCPVKVGLERIETGRKLASGKEETILRPRVASRTDYRVFYAGSRLGWLSKAIPLRGWFREALRAALRVKAKLRPKLLLSWDAAPRWARDLLSRFRGVRVDPALLLLSG